MRRPEDYLWSTANEWATGQPGPIPIDLQRELPFGLEDEELHGLVVRYQSEACLDSLAPELSETFLLPPEEDDTALRDLLDDEGLS